MPFITWQVLIEKKDPEKALELYNKAIELDPNNSNAFYHLAVLIEKKDPEKALELYNKAIELDPNNSNAFYHLAISGRNDPEKALELYNKAIELDPRNYLKWISRGQHLEHLQRYDEAKSSYQEALKLNFTPQLSDKIKKMDDALTSNTSKSLTMNLASGRIKEFETLKKRYSLIYGNQNKIYIDFDRLATKDLVGIDLSNMIIKTLDLSNSNLKDSKLNDSDLSLLNLSYSNLTNADLSRTDLTNANLTGADLTNANLTGADLTNANLTNAILSGSIFRKLTIEGTVLPDPLNDQIAYKKLTRDELSKYFSLSRNFENAVSIEFVSALEKKENLKNLFHIKISGTISRGFIDILIKYDKNSQEWIPDEATFDVSNYSGTLEMKNEQRSFLMSVDLLGIVKGGFSINILLFEDSEGNTHTTRRVVDGIELI